MPFNGSGVFNVYTPGNPVVTGTTISSTVNNNTNSDFATGLSSVITKNGTTTITANIPLSGFKLTGVGLGTASTDAATLANLQAGSGIYVATVGGTADAITLAPAPAISAYAAGQMFDFIASGDNTTAVTVAVSGLAAKAITKNGAVALVAGDIISGSMVSMVYDGTQFQLVRNASVGLAGAETIAGVKTFSSKPVLPATTPTGNEAASAAYVATATGPKSMQTFVANGTWTKPAGIARVIVCVTGSGGGGGGCALTGSGQVALAAPGGAGGYAEKIIDVSAIASATITIGAAGAAGAAGNNAGGTGGNAVWSDGTNTLTGSGGVGGAGAAANGLATPSLGGAATGGTINVTGNSGTLGFVSVATAIASSTGGSSRYGAGGRSVPGVTAAGQPGTGNGSGGGGGANSENQAAVAGGAGTIGIVVVYEY